MKRHRVRQTEDCRRCGRPAENPCISVGKIPVRKNGVELRQEEVDHLVLCSECMELMRRDPITFWTCQWEER